MEDLKIITLVTIPTEWVSSITFPRKPDGTLHICLDPRDLNKGIIREHYKAPTLEEISHKLAGATVFSKLDTKDGFWSIHLDDASSHLTTFNTHKGRCRFLRMPFGLKRAQDVFQMRMDQITERLPGIIAIYKTSRHTFKCGCLWKYNIFPYTRRSHVRWTGKSLCYQ